MQAGRLGAPGRGLTLALWVVLAGSIYVFVITFAFAASVSEKRAAATIPEAPQAVAEQAPSVSRGERALSRAYLGVSSLP